LADNLEPVRLQDPVEEPEDRERDEPAIDGRGDGIRSKQPAPARRQKRIGPLAQTEQPRAELALNDRSRFLPQVRDFEQVRQDVVAVKPHQWIGVEQERAYRADKHHVQREVMNEARLAEPPDERGDRRQD
jgi:hypothetical protein